MYDVTQYGIVGDGTANNTAAIAALIERAAAAGGGTIYFPPGKYLTGSVELKSHMTLYLDNGAELIASGDRGDYPIIDSGRIPGLARRGYAGIISAFNAENVCVRGEGTINGMGSNWWFFEGDYMRPRTVYFVLCNNVRIEGVTLVNSPCWTVHPLCCEDVVIDSVHIKNPPRSPNTDGINPESCKNVRITNCLIDVGDDCIAIKAGSESDPLQKQHPCENIIVSGCTMNHGHGGVVIGSEMSGGVKNVTVSSCVFSGTDRGIRIKTRRGRSGSVSGVLVNGVIMQSVGSPVTVNCYYRCGADPGDAYLFSPDAMPADSTTPTVENVNIRGIVAADAKYSAMYFLGLPERPIRNITLSDISISMTADFGADEPIMTPMHVKTCGEGVYMENVSGVAFRNVRIFNAPEPYRFKNADGISLSDEKMY